ncbi:hypothetical protein V2G26_006855 [Clonostachys chloroleuca]
MFKSAGATREVERKAMGEDTGKLLLHRKLLIFSHWGESGCGFMVNLPVLAILHFELGFLGIAPPENRSLH